MSNNRHVLLLVVAAFAVVFGLCGGLAAGALGGYALGYGTLAAMMHMSDWYDDGWYVPEDDHGWYDQPVVQGALVISVAPASPAAVSGIRPEDLITSVNGDVIDAYYDFRCALERYARGDSLTLTVLTGSTSHDVTVRLSSSPTDSARAYLGIGFVMFGTATQTQAVL